MLIVWILYDILTLYVWYSRLANILKKPVQLKSTVSCQKDYNCKYTHILAEKLAEFWV